MKTPRARGSLRRRQVRGKSKKQARARATSMKSMRQGKSMNNKGMRRSRTAILALPRTYRWAPRRRRRLALRRRLHPSADVKNSQINMSKATTSRRRATKDHRPRSHQQHARARAQGIQSYKDWTLTAHWTTSAVNWSTSTTSSRRCSSIPPTSPF